MVCVPCFIIPVLLVICRLFIQPIILRFWNPWAKKDEKGNVIQSETDFPFKCVGGSCKFVAGSKKNEDQTSENNAVEGVDKENGNESKKQQ